MSEIEQINPTDSGKVAFEKTGRNIETIVDKINGLSNTKSEYIGKAFVSDEILLDATYPIAYCGSVVNSSTMPNTGQFRVQYIPYFANNEGYSVQIAWGVVTNSGLWYRMANGTRWERWESFSTTTKTDISSSSLLNGWTMWGNGYGDNLVGCKTGKQVQLNGLLRCGVKTQNTLILTLPEELRPTCSIIKNVSCYPYGTATIEIQSVGNVLVGNIGEGTLAISMGDVSYSTL